MTRFIFFISAVFALGYATASSARDLGAAHYCQVQVPAAVMGSAIWYRMGYPFNLTANNLGLIPGSTAYQLTELAYQLQQQSLSENAITQQVQQRCTAFSVAELAQEHSFLAQNGVTAPELTVCGDVTTLIVQSFSLLQGQAVNVDNLLTAMLGEQHVPTIQQLTAFAVPLKQQQQLETRILEQLFEYCQAQSESFKTEMATAYYRQ